MNTSPRATLLPVLIFASLAAHAQAPGENGCLTLDPNIESAIDSFGTFSAETSVKGLTFDEITDGRYRRIMSRAMQGRRSLAEAWHMAAKSIYAEFPKATFYLLPGKRQTLAVIQEIAGKERATEEGKWSVQRKEVAVRWYRYGWTHFGATDGMVFIMRADCTVKDGQ